MYHIRICNGYRELSEFIDKANKENLEIITLAEAIRGYNYDSRYTIIYQKLVEK